MATVELCPGSILGAGFTLLVGLSEIHVPRMWVEEDNTGHHVSNLIGLYMYNVHIRCIYAGTCMCTCTCKSST